MRRPALTRWLLVCAPLLLTACATIGPPLPPSLELPKPPSDLRVSRKGERVTLTWTLPAMTTDRQTIHALGETRICRSTAQLKDCGIPVGQVPAETIPASTSAKQKPQASYTESVPETQSDTPAAYVNYAIEVLNKDGRGAGLSNQVQVSAAHTISPPQNFQARVAAQGIVLSWEAGPSAAPKAGVRYIYRIYRSMQDSPDRVLVGEIPVNDERTSSIIDTSFEWGKTYDYRAQAVTVIEEPNKAKVEVEGDDTANVKIFADDIFPPAIPTALQAVFSGPGQKPFVDLVWAPVTDADLSGYNVYRREAGATPAKLNSELVRAPAYRDTTVETGKRYVYSVTAVDLRGNESGRSPEASESVP